MDITDRINQNLSECRLAVKTLLKYMEKTKSGKKLKAVLVIYWLIHFYNVAFRSFDEKCEHELSQWNV